MDPPIPRRLQRKTSQKHQEMVRVPRSRLDARQWQKIGMQVAKSNLLRRLTSVGATEEQPWKP
jgi:hypothetical protein